MDYVSRRHHENETAQPSCCACTGRRGFLTGMAALGAAAAMPQAGEAVAKEGAAKSSASAHWIDVHHHLLPPTYTALMIEKKIFPATLKGWTPEKAIEEMDRSGVATGITSIVSPGVWFGDNEAARRLARECNEYAAKLVADHAGRFGMFTTLPLPDVDGALSEIAYALDTLKADGVHMWTSYRDKWLGHPSFAPVFEELNRRKAVIYTHPKIANCCDNLIPGLPTNLIEYGADTSRTIASLVFGGASQRYPDIRIIFSHGGGAVPYLIERFRILAQTPDMMKRLPQGAEPELQRFYYDTAQATHRIPMTALRTLVPVSHIVFGTDYPYRTEEEHVKAMKENKVFSAKELQAIGRGNVAGLLPRYAA